MFRRRERVSDTSAAAAEVRLRDKYISFRRLLGLNSECLELTAGLQEDLHYYAPPPLRDVLGGRVASIFEKARGIVEALGKMSGTTYPALTQALNEQLREVGNDISLRQESSPPRLAVGLSGIGSEAAGEVGGKAAALGEIKNKLGLPVPNGFVLTTEAYRLMACGSQLDMYMSSHDAMKWYTEQFLAGNYSFAVVNPERSADHGAQP